MNAWGNLLRDRPYRWFTFAFALQALAAWMLVTALPIIVAQRYGINGQLVLSLFLQVLPRAFLIPLASYAILRFGAVRITMVSAFCAAAIAFGIVFSPTLAVFQLLVLLSGVVAAIAGPAMLTSRSRFIESGLELPANALLQGVDRFSKILGPLLAGGAALLLGASATYGLIAIVLIIAGCILGIARSHERAMPSDEHLMEAVPALRGIMRNLIACAQVVRRDAVLLGILVPSATYMITLGAFSLFLFWMVTQHYGLPSDRWAILLAAHGAGSLIGSVICGTWSTCLRRTSVLTLFLVATMLEGGVYVFLLLPISFPVMAGVLVISGIPEAVAYATYFTAVQQRMPGNLQGAFYSISLPVFDGIYALGLAFSGLYTSHVLTLSTFWILAIAFTVIPALPFFFVSRKSAAGVRIGGS